MDNTNMKKTDLKQKVIHELKEYWINVIYLALFFGVFTMYRRILLKEYQVASYLHYGFSLVKALILSKVIMIGDMVRLGRGILVDKPLIVPTVFNAVVFTVWVAIFTVCEHMVEGMIHGKGLSGGIQELMSEGMYEMLGRAMVVFFVFIPFFAFRELERALGEGKVRDLFFRKRLSAESDSLRSNNS